MAVPEATALSILAAWGGGAGGWGRKEEDVREVKHDKTAAFYKQVASTNQDRNAKSTATP